MVEYFAMTEPSHITPPLHDLSTKGWVWCDKELCDAVGETIATVTADIIYAGDERLLIESVRSRLFFRVRATATSGEVFTVAQRGVTNAQLRAQCGNRNYRLDRTRPIAADRRIAGDRGVVAYTHPRRAGFLEAWDGPAADLVPVKDLIFLTWVCVMADVPLKKDEI